MQLSLSSISAGAMTAAVSLGSFVQSVGASAALAAQTLPSVAAGGLQAMGQGAATAAAQVGTVTTTAAAQATTAVASIPQALPGAVNAGAATTAKLASDLALVEKPAKAIATAVPKASLLMRTAGFLSKALPIVTIGAGTLAGARIVNDQGVQALVTTKDGRGAMLGTIGGALLLVPHPASQLAAAGMLGAVAVNQFGGMDRLDSVRLAASNVQPAQRQVA
jgi:hypothetical protein